MKTILTVFLLSVGMAQARSFVFDADDAKMVKSISWYQAETVSLTITGCVPGVYVWDVVSATNQFNVYISQTGSMSSAGLVSFTLTPSNSNVEPGIYNGYARELKLDGSTVKTQYFIGRQTIRVAYAPDSRNLPFVGPLSHAPGVETDPIWVYASDVVTSRAAHGESAYSWGSHATNGYVTGAVIRTESDPTSTGRVNKAGDTMSGPLAIGNGAGGGIAVGSAACGTFYAYSFAGYGSSGYTNNYRIVASESPIGTAKLYLQRNGAAYLDGSVSSWLVATGTPVYAESDPIAIKGVSVSGGSVTTNSQIASIVITGGGGGGGSTNSTAWPVISIANNTTQLITRSSGPGAYIALTNTTQTINFDASVVDASFSFAFCLDYSSTNSLTAVVTNTGAIIGWSAIALTNTGGQIIFPKPQGGTTLRADQ